MVFRDISERKKLEKEKQEIKEGLQEGAAKAGKTLLQRFLDLFREDSALWSWMYRIAINAAKIAGAGKVIAADPLPEKRELAKVLGATDTVDALADDAAKQIIELSGGGVDWGIEAVGRQAPALAANVLGVFDSPILERVDDGWSPLP